MAKTTIPERFVLSGQKWRVQYGQVIRDAKNSGLSYSAIASKAGVSWQTVKSHALVETRDPRMRTVVSILDACGYDVNATSR